MTFANWVNESLNEGYEKDKDLLKAVKQVMFYAKELERHLKTKDQQAQKTGLKSNAQRCISQLEIILDVFNKPQTYFSKKLNKNVTIPKD